MNLTLELINGRQAGARREIRISPFRVGTDSFSDWVLPPEQGSQSGQVTISRASDGFFLRASGTVLLEGHPLDSNIETRLGHGAQLTIGGSVIRAMVSYESGQFVDATLSEAPTISSILSDVTPAGESAGSILPGLASEGILSGVDDISRTRTPLDGIAAAPTPGPKLLPDDWNATSSASEHAAAPDTVVKIGEQQSEKAAASADAGKAFRAFLRAAGVEDEFRSADPMKLMESAGGALAAAAKGLSALEDGFAAFHREFGLPPSRSEQADFKRTDAGTLLSGESYLTEARVAAQFARLIEHQVAMAQALSAHLEMHRNALSPDAIITEAKAKGGLALLPKAQYWDGYCTTWIEATPPRFSTEEFAETYARMSPRVDTKERLT